MGKSIYKLRKDKDEDLKWVGLIVIKKYDTVFDVLFMVHRFVGVLI